MRSLKSELVRVGILADIDKFEEELMEDDSEMTPIQRKLILRRLALGEKMARKASPNTQYKKLEEAMTKLEPEQQLRWIYKFLKELDTTSLVMGGVLDCLSFYIDDIFTDLGMYVIDDNPLSGTALIAMAQETDTNIKTIEEALELLRNAGFKVENTTLGESNAGELSVRGS